jgi:hypothetical protein
MTRPDYASLGFTVSAPEAREILEVGSVNEVYDLVRTGVLDGLHTFREGRAFMLFHPDELTGYAYRVRTGKLQAAERYATRLQRILRDYLRSHTPLPDYDEACDTGYPLLAGTSASEGDAVYIRPEFVVEWFRHTDDGFEHPITKTTLDETLHRIGAIRRRGFVAVSDRSKGTQRWSQWWRLPASFVDGAIPDPAPAPLRTDDKVVRGVRGPAYLSGELGSQS